MFCVLQCQSRIPQLYKVPPELAMLMILLLQTSGVLSLQVLYFHPTVSTTDSADLHHAERVCGLTRKIVALTTVRKTPRKTALQTVT